MKNSHNQGGTGRQKQNQVGLLEIKTTISKNEDTLNGLKLNTVEEKFSESENMATEIF